MQCIDHFLKLFFANSILYAAIQGIVKASIILFYLQVFPHRTLRLLCFFTLAVLILKATAYLLIITLRCLPVSAEWDASVTATCLPEAPIGISGGCFAILEDFWIIALPIRHLLKLTLDRTKKMQLVAMFTASSFAVATSIVRLVYLIRDGPKSSDATCEGHLPYFASIRANLLYRHK